MLSTSDHQFYRQICKAKASGLSHRFLRNFTLKGLEEQFLNKRVDRALAEDHPEKMINNWQIRRVQEACSMNHAITKQIFHVVYAFPCTYIMGDNPHIQESPRWI